MGILVNIKALKRNEFIHHGTTLGFRIWGCIRIILGDYGGVLIEDCLGIILDKYPYGTEGSLNEKC